MSKWEWKKLKDVCVFIGDGDWIESKDQSSKGIRLIQTGNIGNGIYLDKKERSHYISETTFCRLHCTEIFPGDCLISRLPEPIGRACVIPDIAEKMITAVDCTIVRFCEFFAPNFFIYYAQSEKYFSDVKSESTGATRKRISRKNLENIKIPVSPLSEQKRIVKFLDEEFSKIDTLKTNAETNLKNVKDLFKVELLKEFSTTLWEKKKLGEVYNFIDYRGVTPNKLKEGIPLITAKNVRMGYIDYSVRDFISESDYKKRQSRGIAHKGDILFTTEAPLGFSAIADLDVFSTGQRVIVFQQFKNEKNICNPFFNWYFQSIEFQKMIKENATGLTATGIKASRLKEIKIPLPPLSVQKEIVARLDKLSENVKRLEANYKQIIVNCDELKKSILKKTFEGDSRSSRE